MSKIVASFLPGSVESALTRRYIEKLGLQLHPEGGYYKETDRDVETVKTVSGIRNLSTTIYYLLTPAAPQGNFHRNKSRTVHTLHRGRGVYVILHLSSTGGVSEIETFVVGLDVENGERMQWIVEGERYKASFLLPDIEGRSDSDGLLISETVVPGFDFEDHDFLTKSRFKEIVPTDRQAELAWLLRKEKA